MFLGNALVNSFTVNTNKGFNSTTYDVSFTKKGKRAYTKANPKTKLKTTKNGVYSMSKGKYTLKVGIEKQTL